MSGDGAHVPNQPKNITLTFGDLPPLYLPTANGGGCVTSGPFKDMSVNLGPASLALPGGATQAAANPLDYNPRCLKRDLTDAINKAYGNYTDIVNLILQNNNIADFQLVMQGIPGSGSIGVHGGGECP
jgi:tyrosinase